MKLRHKKQKCLGFTKEIDDLIARLQWEIQDLTDARQVQNKRIAFLLDEIHFLHRLLDKYSTEDIPNEKKQRNPTIVKKARQTLRHITTCAYCQREGGTYDPDNNTWHMDHIIALSTGGQDSLSNIVKACRRCNLSKWAFSIEPANGTLKADGTIYYRTKIA